MKKFMTVAAVAAISACTAEKPEVLVLYYSQTGATKAVAEEIASGLGADIEAFDVEEAYDGDFQQTIQRCLTEMENNVLSPVKELKSDLSEYDIIFLGYPVWFGVAARPVLSLAQEIKFEGKTIIPFCTFGSGGLESSTENLKELLPGAEFREGFGIRNARLSKAPAEIGKFLVKSGFKDGEVEVLPEFSERRNVTEEDASIFNAACGSYEMPLGNPVSTAERPVPGGKEYVFSAVGQGMDGSRAENTIFVLAPDGETPEFTKVIR